MKKKLDPQQYSTPFEQQSKLYVTMNHPGNPFHGQRLEVRWRHTGQNPFVFVRFPDGTESKVEPSWVIDEMEVDHETELYLLDYESLCGVVKLINQMRSEDRFPNSDHEESK